MTRLAKLKTGIKYMLTTTYERWMVKLTLAEIKTSKVNHNTRTKPSGIRVGCLKTKTVILA